MPDHPSPTPTAPLAERATDADATSLLRALAHDLCTPLAGVRNATQLVRTARDPKVAAQALAILERQSARLVEVVEDVVDLATRAAGPGELTLATLDIEALADAAVELTASTRAQRNQSVAVARSAEELTVRGDKERLVRSLARVLDRASDATPRAGQIRLAIAREGAQAVLRVCDGGQTLDASRMGQLLPSPDAGRVAAQKTSAVSLPLVARVFALHGGTVTMTRGPAGMETVLTLPFVPGPAGRRILVVDDDRDTADVLCSLLVRDGHAARAVYRASEVLPAALEFDPDTVLLDIGLPDQDGLAVARELRGHAPWGGMRIYALSGYGQPLDQQRSREAGVDEHLTKPIALDRLRELLRLPGGP